MNLRLIVAASIVALLGLAAHRSSAACSCMMPPPPQEAMAGSAAVFEGTVTEVHGPKDDLPGSREVDLQIGRRFKGAEADTVTVTTAGSSAACGYSFEVGRTYLVYANDGDDGQLSVSLCSRTARIEDAGDDLSALGASPAPAPQPPPAVEPGKRGCGGCSTGAPVDGVAGLLLVMAAALALRRRA
jgi:MYXO-CTERM domain-containing protein